MEHAAQACAFPETERGNALPSFLETPVSKNRSCRAILPLACLFSTLFPPSFPCAAYESRADTDADVGLAFAVDSIGHPWYDEGGFDQSYRKDGFRGARVKSTAVEGTLPEKRRKRGSRRKSGVERTRRAWLPAKEVGDCHGLAARWSADLSGMGSAGVSRPVGAPQASPPGVIFYHGEHRMKG